MSEKTVAQKLVIKDNYRILFVNQPSGYEAMLGELPEHVTVLNVADEPIDLIQVFVTQRKGLEGELDKFKHKLSPKGLLWVTYPKGTSQMKVDINRDIIAQVAQTVGLKPVAMISIDDTWSALRLKVV